MGACTFPQSTAMWLSLAQAGSCCRWLRPDSDHRAAVDAQERGFQSRPPSPRVGFLSVGGQEQGVGRVEPMSHPGLLGQRGHCPAFLAGRSQTNSLIKQINEAREDDERNSCGKAGGKVPPGRIMPQAERGQQGPKGLCRDEWVPKAAPGQTDTLPAMLTRRSPAPAGCEGFQRDGFHFSESAVVLGDEVICYTTSQPRFVPAGGRSSVPTLGGPAPWGSFSRPTQHLTLDSMSFEVFFPT